MSKLNLVDGWSCDERNRAACRNPHGCHCREITALRSQPATLALTEGQRHTLERIKLARAAGIKLHQFWLDFEQHLCVSLALTRPNSRSGPLDTLQACTCTRMIQEAHKPPCPLASHHHSGE